MKSKIRVCMVNENICVFEFTLGQRVKQIIAVPVAIGDEYHLRCGDEPSARKLRTSRAVVQNKHSVRFEGSYGTT